MKIVHGTVTLEDEDNTVGFNVAHVQVRGP